MSVALPFFENRHDALRVTGVISILTHCALLGALAWAFPYKPLSLPPKDEGIVIDLTEIPPEPPQVAQVQPPPPPEAVEPEPPKPEPAPVKAVKPKVAKPKPAPSKTTPVKTVAYAPKATQAPMTPAKPVAPSAPVKDPSNPKPAYPDLARKRGQEGTARVRCMVSPQGVVTDASLAQSSGHKLLDEAAVKAAKKWKFRPAMNDGKAVTGTVVVPVEFRLR